MRRRDIGRAIRAGRPPAIQRVIDATAMQTAASPFVSLSVGRSIVEALDRLPLDPDDTLEGRTLLIPDPRHFGQPGPRLAFAVASWMKTRSRVTIALPTVPSDTEGRRWKRLADRSEAELAILGRAGWNRVEFGDRSLILSHADVPAELQLDSTVVALSDPSDAGCLGLWARIVHPNTALRARLSPNAGVELSAAVDARYLLAGQIGLSWVATWATSAIAAELAARGIERMRKRSQGVESPGPWEDAGVQHLSGIGDDGLWAAEMVLRARLEDNDDAALARTLSEMLGWKLEIEWIGGVGGIGG